MTNIFDKLLEANKLVEDFKTAILVNTRIRILDENGNMVWSCADDFWRDKRFDKLEVQQDIDVYSILNNLKEIK